MFHRAIGDKDRVRHAVFHRQHGKMIIAGVYRQKIFQTLLRFVLNFPFVLADFADVNPFHLTG